LIARYGKPVSNFSWTQIRKRGLNAALAGEALADARA
jgi:hypothetical protein